MTNKSILIAKITKPHGVRGLAKVMSYSENPDDIFNYPCLYDENLKEYKLEMKSKSNNMFIVSFNNNTCRNLVEEISGTNLYINRESLPNLKENEYYNNDLQGLEIIDRDAKLHGHVLEIHNFGGGDIIEMKLPEKKETVFIPFDKEFIIEINLDKKYMIFDFIASGV